MAKRPTERNQRQLKRDYEARQALHQRQQRRKRRDEVYAVVGAALVFALAGVSIYAYSAWGPGRPTPEPTASAEATDAGDGSVGAPDASLAEGRTWTGSMVLNGDLPLGFELDGALAPQAVAGIVQDSLTGYYVGKTCHRLADSDGFQLLQCGSLDGTGAGDPDFQYGPIENAPADDTYPAGTIAMARASGDAYSNGHQFFIVTADTYIPSDEAGGYTVVGRVTSGLDELITRVVSAGTADGSTDGTPAVAVTIDAFTVE